MLCFRIPRRYHGNAGRKVLSGEITSLSATTKGVRNSNNAMRIPIMAVLYQLFGPSRSPRSCNLAIWRKDLIRVNGYDENFEGWGYEDTELVLRLNNSGVTQRCMKFRGIVFHIYHKEASRDNKSKTNSATKTASAATGPAARRGSTGILPRKYPTRPAEGRPSSSAADPVRCEFAARYFSNDDFSGKRVSRNVRTRIRSSSVIRTSSFRQNNDGSYFSIIDSRLGR